MWIVYVTIGVLVGGFVTYIYNKHKLQYIHVGTIKVHRDEGEEYLFLEVKVGGMSKIRTEKQVLLDVDLNNYDTQ